MLNALPSLRVALLSSRRCPGALDLLSDEDRGITWEFACVLTTEEEFADADLFRTAGFPVLRHPIRPFYSRRGVGLPDLGARAEYDARTADLLGPHRPDLLLLSSYLYVVTPVLIAAAGGWIANIHGTDLTGAESSRRYLGLHAVADAVLAGEPETRATAHWVTPEVDQGPPIARSRPFPVAPMARSLAGHPKALKAYAYAHQEWMLREAWGPLWLEVLRRVVTGRTAPDFDRRPAAALEEALRP